MGQKQAVVIEEDHFAEYEHRLTSGVQDVRRWAGNAVESRAKQLIIAWDAIQTGDLYRSVAAVNVGDETIVEATVPYASYVHDGTHNADGSERMRARPFLAQAVNDMAPEVQFRLRRVLERDYE